MIQCLECGADFKRIQWTHLKREHDGMTMKEYMVKHPDSPIKDESVISSVTLSNQIAKYGEEEGTIRWNSYCEKQRVTNTFEYKNQKYGMTEEEFSEYNKSRSVTLENCINRHGLESGTKVFKEYCEKQKDAGTSERYFIGKYGETEGKLKYKEVCSVKGHTPSTYIRRLGELKGRAKFIEYRENGRHTGGQSLWAKDFINNFININSDIIARHNNSHDGEFCIIDWDNDNTKFYDLTIPDLRLIIELQGDLWHANPKLYHSEYKIPRTPHTAGSKWLEDSNKKVLAESHGYTVYYIWESEYNTDKENTLLKIQKVIDELRGK